MATAQNNQNSTDQSASSFDWKNFAFFSFAGACGIFSILLALVAGYIRFTADEHVTDIDATVLLISIFAVPLAIIAIQRLPLDEDIEKRRHLRNFISGCAAVFFMAFTTLPVEQAPFIAGLAILAGTAAIFFDGSHSSKQDEYDRVRQKGKSFAEIGQRVAFGLIVILAITCLWRRHHFAGIAAGTASAAVDVAQDFGAKAKDAKASREADYGQKCDEVAQNTRGFWSRLFSRSPSPVASSEPASVPQDGRPDVSALRYQPADPMSAVHDPRPERGGVAVPENADTPSRSGMHMTVSILSNGYSVRLDNAPAALTPSGRTFWMDPKTNYINVQESTPADFTVPCKQKGGVCDLTVRATSRVYVENGLYAFDGTWYAGSKSGTFHARVEGDIVQFDQK